jgi:hypothetical protein
VSNPSSISNINIKNAVSWPELHEKLSAVGLRFEKKGSDAILFVGEIAVKASSVDRAFSMGALRKRLGEFTPGDYPEEKAWMEPPVIYCCIAGNFIVQRTKSAPDHNLFGEWRGIELGFTQNTLLNFLPP